MLVVTPYYVRPNRRGIKAHYEAVAAATDLPIVAYNIPSRTATDMPNDLLAELAPRSTTSSAVKQARYEDMAPIEGMDLLAGNDDVLAKVMDMGGTGGICVASHLVGARDAADRSTSPTAATRSRTACATSTRRCPSPPTRSRSRPR